MTADDDPAATVQPRRYYDEYGLEEWERLEATVGGRLEFAGTTDYLEDRLPSSGRVLDAGGGAGRYAVWLAERGYDVTLVDLSARQCEIAAGKAAEHGVAHRVTVQRGDLRALPFPDDAFDAVVSTGGPVSHVVEKGERADALAELRRVARSDAPTFVSVMGRLAVLQNLVREPGLHTMIPTILETGTYTRELAAAHPDQPTFVECHFFRAAELEAELDAAGFAVDELVGLEAVAANVGERIDADELGEEEFRRLLEHVRDCRTDPSVVDWANHILAVARA